MQNDDSTVVSIDALAVLSRAEIDQQIATAKAFPRSIATFRKRSLELVTLNEDVARSCIYALPRKDGASTKIIEGGSIRFAEIILSAWGNSRTGARIVSETKDFVAAQGIFHDLETNVMITREVQRRITNKHGKRYNADMIAVTGNAGASIALRNAILSGIPKAVWGEIYSAGRKVIAGDVKTLANRRSAAIAEFVIFGVTEVMLLAKLGRKGVQEITIDDLVTLHGMLTMIREEQTSAEELFRDDEGQAPAAAPAQPKAKAAAEVTTTPQAETTPAKVETKAPESETTAVPDQEEPPLFSDEFAATVAAFDAVPDPEPKQKPPAGPPPAIKTTPGNGAKSITAGAIGALRRALQKAGKSEVDVCHRYQIDAIEAMKIADFNDAMKFVEGK